MFTWADLPPDIVFKILEEIAKDRSGYDQTSSLVLLRLVSKSWKAAVAAYPARLACYAVCLPAVCKLFPKMANATILLVNDSTSVRLAPLAQCSQLSSVTLASRATDPKRVLLQDLPPSVRKLQLRGLLVDEICLGEASHLPITHFTVFSGSVADLSDLTALPEKLPFIQVTFSLASLMPAAICKISDSILQPNNKCPHKIVQTLCMICKVTTHTYILLMISAQQHGKLEHLATPEKKLRPPLLNCS